MSRAIKDLGSPLSPRAKEVKRSALGSPLTLIVLRAVVSLIAWTRTPLFPFSPSLYTGHWIPALATLFEYNDVPLIVYSIYYYTQRTFIP